jgi:hypothetical protein
MAYLGEHALRVLGDGGFEVFACFREHGLDGRQQRNVFHALAARLNHFAKVTRQLRCGR